MTDFAFIIVFLLLFLFSIYIGFLIGQGVCERWVITTRDYWVWNLGGVVVMAVLSMFAAVMPMLYAVLVGLLAGYIAGLKMSFGESTGPWKALDRFMNANRRHQRVAKEGTGEEQRRRRRSGERGPDLISVESGQPGAAPQGDESHGGASQGATRGSASKGNKRSNKKDSR